MKYLDVREELEIIGVDEVESYVFQKRNETIYKVNRLYQGKRENV